MGECLPTLILRIAEWCTLRLADVTIATNESYKRIQIERGKRDPETVFIVRNGPCAQRMTLVPPSSWLQSMNKSILVYIGSLNPQDGVDCLLRSLRYLRQELKRDDFYCVIMGTGDSLDDLRRQARELRLHGNVTLTGFVSDHELQANLAGADICMDPDPSVVIGAAALLHILDARPLNLLSLFKLYVVIIRKVGDGSGTLAAR